MQKMEPCSVDAIVTDPPYEIGFMGKAWDGSGIAFKKETWEECLRVLKPGGHMLVFGFSRNYHRLACAIEDAGFEVRDCIMWIYGSGFPKSHNVSKAIDKAAGAEREVIGRSARHGGGINHVYGDGMGDGVVPNLTASATPEAQQWDGWGTALKPAYEPIMVARKPLEGTVVANVLAHGVGGINIDASRVGDERVTQVTGAIPAGRWPANVILDEEAGEVLDEQSGETSKGHWANRTIGFGVREYRGPGRKATDSGGASRFFYCAKASKSERNAAMATGDKNHHPTVKPLKLMRYLCGLITPPGGVILDPFMGSGSTGVAAVADGYKFVGVELSDDYLDIARARIEETQAGE